MARKWWTLIGVCTGTFMLLLDVTIVVVALPDIQRALGANFAAIQWVVDSYALTLASLLLTGGVLADRYGRRLLFAIGVASFTVGSATCGFAASTTMLIASRSAQGVGGALMFATSLAILGHTFVGRERGIAFGIWGAVTGAAVSLGPILGGVITSDFSWRGIFLVNVPVGGVALAITLTKMDESRAPNAVRPDWPGFVLLTTGLLGVVYGLIRASETSWGDAAVLASLTAGGLLLVGFVVTEWKVRNPLFDLALFRIPTFSGGLVAALAMNGSLFAVFLYLVIYLQDLLGFSALATGERLLLSSGAVFVASAVSGRLSAHVPARWLIAPGLALVGGGLVLMSGLDAASHWTHLIPGLVVSGLGAGLVNPPLAATAIGVVPPARAGMASGVNTTFRQVGFAASVAALGTIFASTLGNQLRSSLASLHQAGRADQAVAAIRHGRVAGLIGTAPSALRPHLVFAIRSAFASAVDRLMIVTAVVAFVGSVASLVLIRKEDFQSGEHGSAGRPGAGVPADVPSLASG
ncbi:MAG: MFS transporter [Actinomycetota bacterium]|nr:MFS transporter [Actinomycetota bacterium]